MLGQTGQVGVRGGAVLLSGEWLLREGGRNVGFWWVWRESSLANFLSLPHLPLPQLLLFSQPLSLIFLLSLPLCSGVW
jgi:hypothetical protein